MAQAFHRAMAMAAAIAGIMTQFSANYAGQQAAMSQLGPYKSRGKGGKRPHARGNGSIVVRRAAVKARNVRRHRRATR